MTAQHLPKSIGSVNTIDIGMGIQRSRNPRCAGAAPGNDGEHKSWRIAVEECTLKWGKALQIGWKFYIHVNIAVRSCVFDPGAMCGTTSTFYSIPSNSGHV